MPLTHWKIAVAASAILTVATRAHAAETIRPNIKPGLWVITSSPQMHGELSIPADTLARLPPEQAAKIQAAMQAAMANAVKPRTFKECMTSEKIARGFDVQDEKDGKCQRTVGANSASDIEVRSECSSGDGNTTRVDAHFQLPDSEQVTGTVNVVSTSGGKTTTINTAVQGKWLSSSCGDVKDIEVVK
jgi:hypothetical protein